MALVLVLIPGCRDRSGSDHCTYSCKAFGLVDSDSCRCTYSCKAFGLVDSGSGRCIYSCEAFRFVGSGSLQAGLQDIFRWWESAASGRLSEIGFVGFVQKGFGFYIVRGDSKGNQKFYVVRRRWRFVVTSRSQSRANHRGVIKLGQQI